MFKSFHIDNTKYTPIEACANLSLSIIISLENKGGIFL